MYFPMELLARYFGWLGIVRAVKLFVAVTVYLPFALLVV